MATQVRPKSKQLYDEDFYVWTESQAELLRERRFEALDLGHLIEEVEALGRAERSGVLNNATVIIEHLLKLERPAKEPRNAWRASVRGHRRRLRRDLSPRLRQILDAELPALYEEVRGDTAALLRDDSEDAAADALPATCPYVLDQITGDWWPQPAAHAFRRTGPAGSRSKAATGAHRVTPNRRARAGPGRPGPRCARRRR